MLPVGLCHHVPGLDGKICGQLEHCPDLLVDQRMQCYRVEAALIEGHLADVVAGALEGIHCAFKRFEILPVHKDLADDWTNDLQGDQTFGNSGWLSDRRCFNIINQYPWKRVRKRADWIPVNPETYNAS